MDQSELWMCIIEVTENNVTERFDLTTQYGCVSVEQVIASDARALQPNTRKAQNSMMLHKLLMSCLSSVGKNKVMTPEYQQKIKVNGQPSGNVLLKIITEIARPLTPASIQMLRNNITNMSDKLAEFGQDIGKFNAYVIEQIQGLSAFGQTYDNVEYHLLNSYDKCTDPVFHTFIVKIKDDHETGSKSYTYDQIMKYAVNKFNFMVQKGEWNPSKGSLDERLLALESKTGRIPRKKEKGKGKVTFQGDGKGSDGTIMAPKGGNWIYSAPPNPKAKVSCTRTNRSGKTTKFYWCSTENGGKCNPGKWTSSHTPDSCEADKYKAQREKEKSKEKDKDTRPAWLKDKEKKKQLKADATIITKESEEDKDEEDGEEKEEGDKKEPEPEKEKVYNSEEESLSEQSDDSYGKLHPYYDRNYTLRRRAEKRAEWLKTLSAKKRREIERMDERDRKKHNK